jgi:peptidylprolyl isomerase
MRGFRLALVIALLSAGFAGCKLKEPDSGVIPAPADVAAPPANAITTASGLTYKVLTVGLGNSRPTLKSTVKVHYTGWTIDGKMFETSTGGDPATFKLTDVIPGWIEVLQLMVAGQKSRVWIPGKLAYDNDPRPDVPKGMLVFDLELIDVR